MFYCIIPFGPWNSKLVGMSRSFDIVGCLLFSQSSLHPCDRKRIVCDRGSKDTNNYFTCRRYTEKDIVAKLSYSKPAVHNSIVRFTADDTLHDRERSGRPRNTISREDLNETGSTVSRRLHKEFGLKSHRPARKPHLTPVIKKKRLDFARCQCHWILVE